MARGFGLAVIGLILIVLGCGFAYQVQTSGGAVQVDDIRFPGENGQVLSGLLYTPRTATPDRPAPGILLSHGFINSREMQSPFAIELSRRGYVVLAMDMSGHGYSGGVLGENGMGGPAALKYLRSLPMVDRNNIGMEGHSMGAVPILAAAKALPDGYRSVVLTGSAPGVLGGPPADLTFPRNLRIVFGQFDEFAQIMWQVPRGAEVPASRKIQAVFGSDGLVVPGMYYGEIGAGTGRSLIQLKINHTMAHFTRAGVIATTNWFQETLLGGSDLPSGQQVWIWKEVGTFAGFVGCILLIVGVWGGLLGLPGFNRLNAEPKPAAARRDGRWWRDFGVGAVLPALTYFPLMKIAPVVFFGPFALAGAVPFAMGAFPEQITNQLVVWALGTGLISLGLAILTKRARPEFDNRWVLALAAAVIAVGAGYGSLWVVSHVWNVDYRLSGLALKLMDGRQLRLFLTYLPFFTLFFLMSQRAFAATLPVRGESTLAAISGALGPALGFLALLIVQYAGMATNGLLTFAEPLNTILAIQFVTLLGIVGGVGAYAWRRTNSYVPGAFIGALFVTWYVVAGTAIFGAP